MMIRAAMSCITVAIMSLACNGADLQTELQKTKNARLWVFDIKPGVLTHTQAGVADIMKNDVESKVEIDSTWTICDSVFLKTVFASARLKSKTDGLIPLIGDGLSYHAYFEVNLDGQERKLIFIGEDYSKGYLLYDEHSVFVISLTKTATKELSAKVESLKEEIGSD